MARQSVPQKQCRAPSQVQRRWQQAFQVRFQAVPAAAWRCVSIDVGKYEHVAVICDGHGNMKAPFLHFGIRESDYQQFFSWVEQSRDTASPAALFGMEPTGHYYQQLAYEINKRYGHEQVYLIQCAAVARRRGDWNNSTFKNDEVDAAIINELLRSGHGRPYQPEEGVYLRLSQWERYRWAREQASTRLKNQIVGHVDRLYPGLVIKDKRMRERYTCLFKNLWSTVTPQRLLELYPQPHTLREATVEDLCQCFHSVGYWMTQPYARKILKAVQELPLPAVELAASRGEFLSRDLASLADMDRHIAEVEEQMVALLDATWGRWLRPTEVAPERLACLVATIGDIRQYANARQLFGRSGLHPRYHDSGIRQQRGQGERMVRTGDRHLRRQLLRFTRCMTARYPSLRSYHISLCQRGKHNQTAMIAVARKLSGMLFTLGTQETPFDPKRLA